MTSHNHHHHHPLQPYEEIRYPRFDRPVSRERETNIKTHIPSISIDRIADNNTNSHRKSAVSISDWPLSPTAGGVLFGPACEDLLREEEQLRQSRQQRQSQRQRSSSDASTPFLPSLSRAKTSHSPHRSPELVPQSSPRLPTESTFTNTPTLTNNSYSHSRHPSSNASNGGSNTPFFLSPRLGGRSPSPSLSRTPSKRIILETSTTYTYTPTPSSAVFTIGDPIKAAYLRVALLFAVSALITWIPTSVHRVYEVIHKESPFGLNVATATVLPLQGVWSGIIFFVTNWGIMREVLVDYWGMMKERMARRRSSSRRSKPARQGKSVYSMWRDTEPAGNRNNRDSWDFLDIGIQERV